MVSPEAMLAFALVSIPLILLPGPSVLFVIGRALSLGRIGALLSVVGNALGSLVAGLAVAFGVGVVVQQSVVLFTVLKVAGGLYIIYLGVQAVRHRNPVADADARRIVVHSKLRLLREGFVVGVTNPKTIVFLIAVLPQFVDHGAGGVPTQMASLAAVFIAVAVVLDTGWALAAGAARDWFARSPQRLSRLGATGGVLMVGIGAATLFVGNGKD
ncbi:LysE family translocator [Marisediminicola antarctica]|uniref:Lysine transporter LysE n=1 Tax=Marisediminicola antarctica TaxID=674079 RepID=A0A7L5AHL5_9MICO|nr:LysE family translocator [Marisediminicola antarctica]QHO69502.1 lysine transporter LysE [Marisediminicola antarctica]